MSEKIFFIALLLSVAIFTSVSAAIKNPANDSNLVLFYQHQGLENYLLKDSLRVSNQDSLKVISFDYIIYDSIQPQNTHWDNVENMAFAYDESARKVYFFDKNGGLLFLNPNGTIAEGSGYAPSAELVYFLVTRQKFYGTFDDNFYITLGLKAGCPKYLDAEKNYILYADLGIQGAGLYIDRKSINVVQEDDGGCIISVDEVQVPDANMGKTEIANRFNHTYSYVYDKKVVMRFDAEAEIYRDRDRWVKINPNITNPEDENFTYDATVAEMTYYLVYGKKFFGTFDNAFYKGLK